MAPFVFENVPQGVHAIVVLRMKSDPPLAVAQDTVQVFGSGATRLVEFVFRLSGYPPGPRATLGPVRAPAGTGPAVSPSLIH